MTTSERADNVLHDVVYGLNQHPKYGAASPIAWIHRLGNQGVKKCMDPLISPLLIH